MEKWLFQHILLALYILKLISQFVQFKNQSNLHYLCLDMKKYVPIEDGDYYLTPEGYRCFTEQYHLKRGYCCESGCRHCPYGYNSKINKKDSIQ